MNKSVFEVLVCMAIVFAIAGVVWFIFEIEPSSTIQVDCPRNQNHPSQVNADEPCSQQSESDQIKTLFFQEFLVEFSPDLSSVERESQLSEIRSNRNSLLNNEKKGKK